MDEGAQPQEGQGAPPYAEHLEKLPEDIRGAVEPVFREWDQGVTKKFQEHADFRRRFEPYEELGLDQYEPETLQELLQLGELAQDDDQFNEWLLSEAEARGLLEGEQGEGEEDDDGRLDPERVQAMLQEQLSPLQQQLEQQERERLEAQAEQDVDRQLAELKKKHGDFDEDAVCQLALAYDTPDALERGLQKYQQLVGKAEKGVVDSKLSSPEPPERGGRPATAQQAPKSFEDPALREQALAMLRADQST